MSDKFRVESCKVGCRITAYCKCCGTTHTKRSRLDFDRVINDVRDWLGGCDEELIFNEYRMAVRDAITSGVCPMCRQEGWT